MNGLPSVSVTNSRSSGNGGLLHQRLQFGDQAKLRDGERTELHFEADEAFGGGLDGAAHGAFAFVGFATVRAIRRSTPSRKVPGADGRIGHDHVGAAKPAGRSNSGPRKASSTSRTIADDHFRRRVIGAGLLAQRVVVDLQEVLVEVEPGLGLALADRLPVDGVEHARQRAERSLQRLLVFRDRRSAAGAPSPISELVLPSSWRRFRAA